ncbi:MAG: ribonuclease P protein component [Candidatus Nomurabacteria bacterium]|nr:ribonuclease P protein component [Candidatus Nomurabacteria bacterium]
MLSKKKRVTKGVFNILLKDGKTFSNSLFLFYFIKAQSPHYAVVAPKGIFKTATQRNKYRRIGYNILRSLPVKSGSGIFMYKKPALIAENKDIKESMVSLLNKINII